MNKDLEVLIDKADRQKVFAIARRLGWTVDNPPPTYVWYEIAQNLIANPDWPPNGTQEPPTLLESLGLGGIF